METPRDEQLIADLKALRPAPRPQFAAELDQRAAAGFPRPWSVLEFSFRWLRSIKPRKVLIPAGGIALIAIAFTTTVVAIDDGRDGSSGDERGSLSETTKPAPEIAKPTHPEAAAAEAEGLSSPAGANAGGAKELNFDGSGSYSAGSAEIQPFSRIQRMSGDVPTRLQNRAVERNAELVLGADPAEVAGDASKVFEAVHAHDGIVMRSSTREGEPGVAGARFELLIPSAKLGDALAALSGIDEVRSRHEATDDITAPTVQTGELLQDSKARIDSLLAQLEAAETESEREAVEGELAVERRHRARLRAQLQNPERRADYSRVLVRIETGASEDSSGGGTWGVDDALGDAGHILAVAAAVSVVALAILGPIALAALLAWLTHRAWVRRERRRVLS